jgi:carbonic anhydrase/acetyltransferase-like protein (isoleucine patch superfamily)
VVTQDVPPRTLAVGVPARVVRRLDTELNVDEMHVAIFEPACSGGDEDEEEWIRAVAASLRRK